MTRSLALSAPAGGDVRLRLVVAGIADGLVAAAARLSAVPLALTWREDEGPAAGGLGLRIGLGEQMNAFCGREADARLHLSLEWASSSAPSRWRFLGAAVGPGATDAQARLRYQRWHLDWHRGAEEFVLELGGIDWLRPVGGRGIEVRLELGEAVRFLAETLATADYHVVPQVATGAFERFVTLAVAAVLHDDARFGPAVRNAATGSESIPRDRARMAALAHGLRLTSVRALIDLLPPEGKAQLVTGWTCVTPPSTHEARAALALIATSRTRREAENLVQRIGGAKGSVADGRARLLASLGNELRAEAERVLRIALAP